MSFWKKENIRNLFVKIFLLWLLLQFFLQTFVMFKLWLKWWIRDAIWMWKEVMIIIWFIYLCYLLIKNKISFKKLPLKSYNIALVLTLVAVVVISLITQSSLSNIVMALRYDFTGFVILPIVFLITYFQYKDQWFYLIERYNRVLKWLVVLSLGRWLMIYIAPWVLDRAGYDQYWFEGNVWVRPPSVYYTQLNQWYVRNQFLFERPISRWFFLVALRPMFFLFNLKGKWRKKMLLWWSLFGLAVLLTFSRASWIAWFFQTIVLVLTQYRKELKKILLYGILPLIVVFGFVAYVWKDQIINRDFSNTGHLSMVMEALEKIKEKPLFWQWAGSAWPVTHQNGAKWYNPENQYLQIMIEFGILWFLWRFALYLYLHFRWLKAYIDNEKKYSKEQKFIKALVFAFSLGVLWLSIEWLVLHSFIDRMIVYPFMALFGIVLAVYFRQKSEA